MKATFGKISEDGNGVTVMLKIDAGGMNSIFVPIRFESKAELTKANMRSIAKDMIKKHKHKISTKKAKKRVVNPDIPKESDVPVITGEITE